MELESRTEQARHLLAHPTDYPAEHVARDFLYSRLLPSLMNLNDEGNNEDRESDVIEAIRLVLQAPHCVSAVMAPYDDGSQEQANPVRRKLFHTLQMRLFETSSVQISDCLVEAVSCAARVRPSAADVEVSLLQSFFWKAFDRIQDNLVIKSALRLLSTVTKIYPGTSRSVLVQWLSQPATSPSRQWLSDSLQHERVDVCECMEGMMHHSNFQPLFRRAAAPSSFQHNLLRGLACLLELLHARIQEYLKNNRVHLHVLWLTREVVLSLQYAYGASLRTRAQMLCGDVFDLSVSLPASKASKHVTDTLIYWMGGRELPNGTVTEAVEPLKAWAASDRGVSWLLGQVKSLRPNSRCRRLLFHALSSPNVAESWDSELAVACQGTALTLLDSAQPDDLRTGLELTVALFTGHVYSSNTLLMRLGELPATTTTRPLLRSIAASFSSSDWSILSQGERAFTHIVEALISIEGEASNKKRSEGCKLLGDACQPLFRASLHCDRSTAVERVIRVLCNLSEDKNHAVRMSALFGIGNLSQVLSESTSPSLDDLSQDNILRLVNVSTFRMSDDNMRVSDNAYRAVGYAVRLLAQRQALSGADVGMQAADHSREILDRCCKALSYSLVSTRVNESAHISWKERQAARKQAWGAANTICVLLQIHSIDWTTVSECLTKCTYMLFDCVRIVDMLQNKTAQNSARALCLMPESFVRDLCSSSPEKAADALVVSLKHIPNDRDGTWKILLKRLFCLQTVQCAAALLTHEEMNDTLLDALYGWIDDVSPTDFPSGILDVLLVAIRQSTTIPVDTEQRFATLAPRDGRSHDDMDEI